LDAIRCGGRTNGIAAHVDFDARQRFRRTFESVGAMKIGGAFDALILMRLVSGGNAMLAFDASIGRADVQTAQSDAFLLKRTVFVRHAGGFAARRRVNPRYSAVSRGIPTVNHIPDFDASGIGIGQT